ncbi:DNA-3-methyladenine glycosylase I [Nocardioides sp. CFH 31398]|uniref:DNA-3-methyladenine glycosylase I n=1 Tax=Nocardioides sp. CFH 31398 TaxID=2919579 RepID=UPI001F05A5FB|nr:DNA-3-methyladenine glycosylase I [Nocardioides sp. CFH 31398]MCH1865216.1 DNA-3-methyladenine glycosylase I [Nocardioides sp. CFH 31398]
MEAVVGEDGVARCLWAATPGEMRDYHDTEWGVPVRGESALFERLTLEAFQSGLSWAIILRKRPAFRAAFAGFDVDAIATWGEPETERLLADAGIVRNRAKIEATLTNARAAVDLRADGGLEALVEQHRPPPERQPAPRRQDEVPTTSEESLALSKALKKRGFRFVGPTTMHALMEALGVVDTHLTGCHRRGVAAYGG